jgi:hypothetical protein
MGDGKQLSVNMRFSPGSALDHRTGREGGSALDDRMQERGRRQSGGSFWISRREEGAPMGDGQMIEYESQGTHGAGRSG